MGIFLVTNDEAKTVSGKRGLVVVAEAAADAQVFAASHFNSDSTWATSTTTALTEDTLDASAAMLGYTWRITITGPTITDGKQGVSATGTGTDDLDAVAALLVTALNGLADIAGAAYAAPNITVASGAGGDDLGDHKVTVSVFPPSGNTNADLQSLFVASITDEGASNAALTVALVADTEARPVVLAEV